MRVCEARFPNWFWRTNHVASDLLGIGLRYNRADTEDGVPVLDSGEQFQEMSVVHAGGVGFDEIVLGSELSLGGGVFGWIWCAEKLGLVGMRIKAGYDHCNDTEPVLMERDLVTEAFIFISFTVVWLMRSRWS